MSRRKRLAKEARLAQKGRPSPGQTTLDVVIPDAGAPTLGNGWKLPWRVAKTNVRRPFAQVTLMLACFVAFTLVKMSGIYLVSLLWWGTDNRDAQLEHWLNAGLWQMGSWLMGPAVLVPWLSASVLFANGLQVRWRVVQEPLLEKNRVWKLALLGVVSLLLAGGVGAGLPWAIEHWGWTVSMVTVGVLWWVSQITFMGATAGVWQENWGAFTALRHALVGWRYNWKAVVASSLSTALLVALVALVFLVTFVGPALALGLPPTKMGWLGFLAMPLLVVLWTWWSNLQGNLALAFLRWSDPPLPAAEPLEK